MSTDAADDLGRRGEDLSDAGSWDQPGRDGDVGDSDIDPDRRELRAEIGKYSSLAEFPATARQLAATARERGAPESALNALTALPADASFGDAQELWDALGLASDERF